MLTPRIPANCAFTSQHDSPDATQTEGAPPRTGGGIMNGGLQVVNPSATVYQLILERLKSPDVIENYEFADQSLLSDLFAGRWVALPYVYNALKTLRWEGVHKQIWRDERVKNIHYILAPKPWAEARDADTDPTHVWWWVANDKRLAEERTRGIDDGF